ncbi:MAG: FAD:protein FMN transferase, partial [Candidatus Omnitrophica bacterium]|nr:FAD:protein FMN transferase [Candidatus Omnitrophota bacterium]
MMPLLPGEKGEWVRHARYRMGTIWEMAVRSADRERALWVLDGAFEEIARLERMMSRFLPESPVNELARRAGLSAVAIDEELAEVLGLAQQVAVLSDGAFDVTTGPLVELWNQAAARGVLPTPDERRAAQALVDYRAVVLDPAGPTAALRNVGMSLDLGAIGKGFAVDHAVERLQAEGYHEGWVNAGGNVRFLGSWDHPVPVRDPHQPDRARWQLSVGGGAVSTSANYERGWEIGDRWYGHLLDPRT